MIIRPSFNKWIIFITFRGSHGPSRLRHVAKFPRKIGTYYCNPLFIALCCCEMIRCYSPKLLHKIVTFFFNNAITPFATQHSPAISFLSSFYLLLWIFNGKLTRVSCERVESEVWWYWQSLAAFILTRRCLPTTEISAKYTTQHSSALTFADVDEKLKLCAQI